MNNFARAASQYKNNYPKNNFVRIFFNIILFAGISFLGIQYAGAQTLPAGFSQVLVANGLSSPTTMAFAPDGRIFVAQQAGQLRIIKNGTLLAQPFVTVSTTASGERGLDGIAFDPNFATNNYIYVFYTLSNGSRNRVSRFTANGDIVVAGSEVVILDLDPLSSATNHNGGSMQFGPDGKLYIGTGENANTDWAQNLDSYHGKILRINADGSVPAGNPYTSGTAQRQRVWSLGLRNPFTLSFQPGTGRLFVNDVGQVYWEEINEATTSNKNFGWAWQEGVGTNPAYTNPIYTYEHQSTGGDGCAITGGTFFNPTSTNYPASYVGKYFFMDYCGKWIKMLTLSGSTATSSGFATNIAGSGVSIKTGTDGNLYFLSRDNSAVYKITYTGSSAPVITNQPQSITVAQGNQASFSVSATGSASLTYQWRKNGTNISGATAATYTMASVTSTNAGTYSVVVSNTSGSVTSSNATLTVTAPNQPPVATITAPASGVTYAGGDVINFTGTGTDPENGTLAASAFTWYVIFHHDTHTHPGPTIPSGVKSGSFTIPNTGETAATVWYRLYLVVTDTQGAKDTTYTDITPRTSTITLNTNPQGRTVTLDGQPFTAPLTVTSVEGILRTISVTSPQTSGSTTYNFSSWSQGGAQTQTFATPVNNVSYTANFTVVSATNTPYGGTARPIPGTIQVEDFDNGGQNIGYYDVSTGNAGGAYRTSESVDLKATTPGGYYIGWTDPGEWTKYTVNVTTTGVYTLGALVSAMNGSSSLRVEMDGTTIATIAVPNTGGYQSWQTVNKTDIYLTAGTKIMRLYCITGGFNINSLSFTSTTVSNYPPVVNAGADKTLTLPTNSVSLSGSATDQDGSIVAYQWTKVSGGAATITTPTSASTTVTGLVQGVYVFQLKATDNNGGTATDNVQVTVNAAAGTGEKMINVNVYGTNIFNNTQWNNWKPVANTASTNFKYSDGTSSTVNATLTKQIAINDNGANYAAAATACPPAVLQYYSTSTATRELTVKGLDPVKKYTFKFYASSTITPNGTTFLINGYGSDDVMTDNNLNSVGQIKNVSPNSTGTVSVVMVSIKTWNFIAGFTIVEQAGSSRMAPDLYTRNEKIKELSADIVVYPNPFSGSVQVQVKNSQAGMYEFSVMDMYGKIVLKKNVSATASSLTQAIETGNLSGGVYYLEVIYPDQQRSVHKLLKNY